MIPPGAGPNARNGGNVMKHKTHRLLSLLIALALLCTLVPTALAAGELTVILTKSSPTMSDQATVPYNSRTTFTVTPSVKLYGDTTTNYAPYSQINYTWTLTQNATATTVQTQLRTGSGSSFDVSASELSSGYTYTVTCSATAQLSTGTATYNGTSAPVSWMVSLGNSSYSDISVSATVYDTSVYSLDDYDDAGGTSIISQIESKIDRDYYLEYVEFTSVRDTRGYLSATTSGRYFADDGRLSGNRDYYLSDVTFTPDDTSGRASFDFVAVAYPTRNYATGTERRYYGTMTFTIEEGYAGTGIVYSERTGNTVQLNAADFENFWADINPRGTLDYVEFTNVTSGNLYSGYNGSRGSDVVDSRNPTPCYVNPTRNRTGLDGLTYVPRNNSGSQVTIRFTAYGTARGSGSNVSRSGTVTILFVSGNATPIEYSAVSSTNSVTLDPNDFTAKYREVVGSTANNITIQFKNAPTNGTLSYRSGSRDVTLTNANISTYSFSSSSGGYRISDLTYTAGKAGTTDTVEFTCYNGGTPRFIGSITFTSKPNVVENLLVSYDCTSSNGVNFRTIDFYNATTAMNEVSYLTFGVPSSGGLYLNNAPITSSMGFSISGTGYQQNVGSVVYRPASGFNGTATVLFFAYSSTATLLASGTVTINVTQPTTPTQPTQPTNPTNPTNPSTPSNPTTPTGKTFSDVPNTPSTSWYYSAVTELANAGIVSGRSDGLFHPKDNVTYGEALKLILLAAGYEKQVEGTGNNWAMPYLTLATLEGLLPTGGEALVLTDAVNRETIAEITCKAMKLSPVTGATSPFTDTNSPYVLALNSAGIIFGTTSTTFEGSKTLTRAEVCVIVQRINNYHAPTDQTPTTPDNTGGSTGGGSDEMPGWLLS